MSQAQLDELLQPLIKPACLLVLSESEAAQPASTITKFGGLPYAEKEESWPCCGTCGSELTFVAQLKQPGENSLYAFFYCFNCSPWNSDDDESQQWLVRSYSSAQMANYTPITPQTEMEYSVNPCHCEEKTVQVLPDWLDLETLSPAARTLCSKMDKDAYYEVYDDAVSRCGCVTDYATLLGGYPKWIQNESVQTCNICHAEMAFFAQIDSESQADLMWGDSGAVYLFRCPEHKSEFKLELQCY